MIKQGGGSIIATASMSAHIVNVPQPQCAYNASKAGVKQLVKSLAVEWAQKNVRVNSISPGYIGTDLVLSSPTLVPLIEQWKRVSPMGRIGRPDEAAGYSGLSGQRRQLLHHRVRLCGGRRVYQYLM